VVEVVVVRLLVLELTVERMVALVAVLALTLLRTPQVVEVAVVLMVLLVVLVVQALFMFVSVITHKEKLCRSISHNLMKTMSLPMSLS
jgi:hypothetical protein